METSSNRLLMLNPSKELTLTPPFGKANSAALVLSTAKADPVAFKIKTNAPQIYTVKPNMGVVRSENPVSVTVTYYPERAPQPQQQRYPPAASADTPSAPRPPSAGHKFLVESCAVPDLASDVATFWAQRRNNPDTAALTAVQVDYLTPVAARRQPTGKPAAVTVTTGEVSEGSERISNGDVRAADELAIENGAAGSSARISDVDASPDRRISSEPPATDDLLVTEEEEVTPAAPAIHLEALPPQRPTSRLTARGVLKFALILAVLAIGMFLKTDAGRHYYEYIRYYVEYLDQIRGKFSFVRRNEPR